MKRLIRSLPLLLIGYCLSLAAAFGQGRNQPKVVPTIVDMLATDPRNFADSFPGTNANFTALVITTGDAVAGAGTRFWRWDAASTAATNEIIYGTGPFAWPYGASAGRWRLIPDASLFVDRVLGGILITNGGFNWYVVPRGITPSMLPAAPSPSVLGRNSGAGSGDLGFLGFSSEFLVTNDVVNIAPSIMASINTGWGSVDSMADMVTAIANPNHPDVFQVKSYWKNNRDVGGGLWFYQATDYPTNLAVPASVKGGRMWPRFENDNVDITKFGAASMYAQSITDPAVQHALAMQQDRTVGGVLWGPDGYYNLLTTIRRKAVGTGTKYVVNNAGGYPIGATNIVLGTGTGTILERDTVTFDSTETSTDYRVVSFNTTNNTLRIAFPGLLASIANGQAMSIRPRPRLLMRGVGHGVVQLAGYRSHGATTYVMWTDNVPIVELGGYHNIVEMMSLQFDNFQTSEKTMAVCIYNPPDEDFYQNHIYGVSMIRPAYGIHVAPTLSSPFKTAPNNFVDEILVESASVSDITWDKSGTMNKGSGWYLQNLGPSTNGISETQTFTNLTKSGSTITLHFPGNLPAQAHEGSFVDVAGTTNFNGQFSILSSTNGQVVYDVTAAQAALPIVWTNGTASTVIKSQMAGTQFKNIAQWAINGLDIEATIGPPSASIPICIDNVGGMLTLDGLHNEYLTLRHDGQSMIRNRGGSIKISNSSIINCGRYQNVNGYIFENDTLDGTAGTAKGVIRVDIFSSRDFSVNAGGSGAWIAGTNKNGTLPVWIGDVWKPANLRMNTTNIMNAGTTVTSLKTNLVFP